MPNEGASNVIPLTPINDIAPRTQVMRDAVLEALRDLFVERVPESERSPYYEKARGLLFLSGWDPEELLEAETPGPRQQALWRALGLNQGVT
jgi:hypothetical protein